MFQLKLICLFVLLFFQQYSFLNPVVDHELKTLEISNVQNIGIGEYMQADSNPFSFHNLTDELLSGYPQVEISYPEVDWFNTSQEEMEVTAKVVNVHSSLDISCMLNGKELAFEFSNEKVTFYARLQRGTNVLKVQVRNEKGEARDIKRVIYTPLDEEDKVESSYAKPLIELMSPESVNFYSDEDVIDIQAYIENAETRDDIKLSANGMNLSTFKYDADLGILNIKVRLAKGTNKFMLTAYNASGKSEQEFFIFYGVDPEEEVVVKDESENEADGAGNEDTPVLETDTKPLITILSPLTNPYYTDMDNFELKAEMHGVRSKEDILFLINGEKNHFFDFDPINGILSDEIHLLNDDCKIELTAKNEFGETSKTLEIRYVGILETDIDVLEDANIIEVIHIGQPDESCYSQFEFKINKEVTKDDIKLTMNDFNIRNFRLGATDLILRFSLYLDEGSNDIAVTVNAGENIETLRVNIFCGEGGENEIIIQEEQVVDTSPASLAMIRPASPYTTEQEDLILLFRADHVNSKDNILIFLNDEIIEDFEFNYSTKEVQVLLTLLAKNNWVLLRVSNDYGTEEKELTYYYDEPFKTKPEVVINAPRNGFKTDEKSIIFRASINFIKSIDDVSVKLNGENFSDFNYNEEYGKLQAVIPLRLGKNTLKVTASNKLGSSQEAIAFDHRMDYVPLVQITGPKEGVEYRQSFAILKAVVLNMKDKRGIGIQINGVPFKSISYDEENETISSRLQLKKGENEIILTAKNEFGFASDTIHLFFRGAPEKPIVEFIKPAKDDELTTEDNYEFEAKVLEINHSSQIDLIVNGNLIEEVYYYKEEKLVKALLSLKKGSNELRLTATNDTGSTSAQTSIYLR